MELPRSPKRRHILSSINQTEANGDDEGLRRFKPDRIMSPDISTPRTDDVPAKHDDALKQEASDLMGSDTRAPRTTKFRFKSEPSRSSRRRERGQDDNDDRRHKSRSPSRDRDRHESRERRHPPRHHHHRRRRHGRTLRSRSPARPRLKQEEPDPFQDPPLSPTTAFRESLFDAMADDEGAAYWESVYGQPIHIYPAPTTTTTTSSSGVGGDGGNNNNSHLERMTDDEYAAYVRQKMWEKTHAGLLEARARREREREEARRKAEEEARVSREMERCLRRGEERRRRKGWRERWEDYVKRWAEWENGGKGGGGKVEGIPWPDGAGNRTVEGREMERETVRAFFVNGIGLDEVGEKDFAARLKEERVRWHPDKMQQRLGGKVDDKVMRDVTAIFQVVDALWNDTWKKGG